MKPSLVLNPCPCGTGQSFGACCGPLIAGQEPAQTAEQLMRSRYTAFCRRDRDYLLRSWDPTTRPTTVELPDAREWRSLEILAATEGGPADPTGTVRFLARYREDGVEGVVDELSRFQRHDGRWVYVSGVQFAG